MKGKRKGWIGKAERACTYRYLIARREDDIGKGTRNKDVKKV